MLRSLRTVVCSCGLLLLSAGPPPRVAPRQKVGATKTKASKAKPPASPQSCTQPSDCVVFCPNAPGCCPSAPCGCRSAINHAFEEAARADFAKSCTRVPNCPAMGCAYEQAMGATCREGRCVATKGPAF